MGEETHVGTIGPEAYRRERDTILAQCTQACEGKDCAEGGLCERCRESLLIDTAISGRLALRALGGTERRLAKVERFQLALAGGLAVVAVLVPVIAGLLGGR